MINPLDLVVDEQPAAEPDPLRQPFDLADFLDRFGRAFAPGRQAVESGDHQLDLGRTAPGGPLKEAAVLMAMLDVDGSPHLILTERTSNLSSHAGQIAFPGGRVDGVDGSNLNTALREAREEIGLVETDVQILGSMNPYITGSGYRIFPVLGQLSKTPAYRLNPDEVAEIFSVPLAFLMQPENHKRLKLKWKDEIRQTYAMPYGRHYIWGVTAGILRTLYEKLYQ